MGHDDEQTIHALLEEILVDAFDDEEQFWAFRLAFEDALALPLDVFVMGEPVSLVEVEYHGNPRRGLVARCRREDGGEHWVSLADVETTSTTESNAACFLAAYRQWVGIEQESRSPRPPSESRTHKATEEDIDLERDLELIVLVIKEGAARCRLPGTDRILTVKSRDVWKISPGQIVTVRPKKHWRFAGHPYLSGEIVGVHVDAALLGLVPLRLVADGDWDPADHYWGEQGPTEEWEVALVQRGPRPVFEMEQVLVGFDPDNPDYDSILESNDRKDAGDIGGAREILESLVETDIRCLDAHAHLGNLAFDDRPDEAIRHYEIGMRIGELSLSDSFSGVLGWGWVDNRPFLRCMNGYGLCLWRLGRFEEAATLFERMLELNPWDNQGARVLLGDVRRRETWTP